MLFECKFLNGDKEQVNMTVAKTDNVKDELRVVRRLLLRIGPFARFSQRRDIAPFAAADPGDRKSRATRIAKGQAASWTPKEAVDVQLEQFADVLEVETEE